MAKGVTEVLAECGIEFSGRERGVLRLGDGFVGYVDPQPAGRGYTEINMVLELYHPEIEGAANAVWPGVWPSGFSYYWEMCGDEHPLLSFGVDHGQPERLEPMLANMEGFVNEWAKPRLRALASWSALLELEQRPSQTYLPIAKAVTLADRFGDPTRAMQALDAIKGFNRETYPEFEPFYRQFERHCSGLRAKERPS